MIRKCWYTFSFFSFLIKEENIGSTLKKKNYIYRLNISWLVGMHLLIINSNWHGFIYTSYFSPFKYVPVSSRISPTPYMIYKAKYGVTGHIGYSYLPEIFTTAPHRSYPNFKCNFRKRDQMNTVASPICRIWPYCMFYIYFKQSSDMLEKNNIILIHNEESIIWYTAGNNHVSNKTKCCPQKVWKVKKGRGRNDH